MISQRYIEEKFRTLKCIIEHEAERAKKLGDYHETGRGNSAYALDALQSLVSEFNNDLEQARQITDDEKDDFEEFKRIMQVAYDEVQRAES
jgi:hypothetical protein